MACGAWAAGTGSDDDESLAACSERSIWVVISLIQPGPTGEGHSEKLLGQIVRANSAKKIYTATKIPPKNLKVAQPPRPQLWMTLFLLKHRPVCP